MERVLERCAGLDVHKKTVTVCVRVPDTGGGRTQHVRTFATTTAELLVAATVAREMGSQLRAPVKRLGAPRAPISYSRPLEDRVRVTVDQVVDAAVKLTWA